MNTRAGPNVDRQEIAKFDRLAERWWDPDGDFRPLHDINPARLDFIDGRAPLAGRRVLDIGCGAGLLSESMASLGARVTGVDPAERNIAIARSHAAKTNLDIEYLVERIQEFLRNDVRILIGGIVFEDHNDSAATETGHGVALANQPRQSAGKNSQQLIPGRMPKGVVDVLKPIQVKKEHGQTVAQAMRAPNTG